MAEIILLRGEICYIDEEDIPKIKGFNWHMHNEGYASVSVGSKTILMHRVLMDAQKGQQVDHKDQNRLNNQKYNLRLTDAKGNQGNAWWSKKGKSSKFKGVSWDKSKQKWRAQIKMRQSVKQYCFLGRFDSEIDAARAYNEAAKVHFGEFALLNPV